MMRKLAVPLWIALAYAGTAELTYSVAVSTKHPTAVWPAAGFGLAAFLLWGNRVWAGVWVGAFVVNALSGQPWWTAAAVATGNTVAPFLGSILLRRVGFDNALERVRDVLYLAVVSALATTVSATTAVAAFAYAHILPWNAFGLAWLVWWTANAVGVLLVAPLMLTWATRSSRNERAPGSAREMILLAALVLSVGWVCFETRLPLHPSLYPFVIWAALRFRQRENAAAVAAVGGLALWGTAHDVGPWTSGPFDVRLLTMDSWITILAVTSFIIGAIAAEIRSARSALQSVLSQTQRAAETLQTAFLPKQLPQRSGLQCDALYIAAEREALIGGDWYDAFDLPDGNIGISIGDVTGHGLDAAVAAARIRGAIFAEAFQSSDPADVLARAEQTLQAPNNVMATAVFAIISPDLGTMRYASAGHPPPMIATGTVPARSLSYGGLPLGFGPSTLLTHTVSLDRGSAVLFYTDGLTEFDRDVEVAERAILQALTQLVGGAGVDRPALFIQQRVMGAAKPCDDTALLVVKLTTPVPLGTPLPA